jgi:hypothetical protein
VKFWRVRGWPVVAVVLAIVASTLATLGVTVETATAGDASDITATNVPTANAVASGGWTNASRVYASDNSYATAAPAQGATVSSYFSGFGFDSIPSNAKIIDVVISAEYYQSPDWYGYLRTQAYVGGVACGSVYSDYNWPTDENIGYNNVSRCRAWTPANLYDANFSVWVGAYRNQPSAVTFNLDQVKVTVKYTAGSSSLTQTGYIFENDDEDEAGGDAYDDNTQQAAGNTAITDVAAGERLNARVQVRNTGPAMTSEPAAIFYDRNDGIWSKIKPNASLTGDTGTGCAVTTFSCTSVDTTNAVGSNSSVAVDSNGAPWISYSDTTNGDLRVAHYVGFGGTGCATAAWQCFTVESTNSVGLYTSIAISGDDAVYVTYYDSTNQDLRIAIYTGSGGSGCASAAWTCSAIASTGNVGTWSSLVIDKGNIPHISYFDATNSNLVVADWVGPGGSGCATTQWTCTTVDSTGIVGDDNSIAVDSSGKAYVSYYDGTNSALKMAQYVGS